MLKEVILANPQGFCAGVARAIAILDVVMNLQSAKAVYVLGQIVHNGMVVRTYEALGVRFIKTLGEIDEPENSILVLSAHGSHPNIARVANERKITVVDSMCPLVGSVHRAAKLFIDTGYKLVIIGHEHHPEIIGLRGIVSEAGGECAVVDSVEEVAAIPFPLDACIAYVTQTTLNIDDTSAIVGALNRRFCHLRGMGLKNICYAVKNRQDAAFRLVKLVDYIVVIGSANSSNTQTLLRKVIACGAKAIMTDDPSHIQHVLDDSIVKIGLTSGASAPRALLDSFMETLGSFGYSKVSIMDTDMREDVHFAMPDLDYIVPVIA